jgi:hypothetical protein
MVTRSQSSASVNGKGDDEDDDDDENEGEEKGQTSSRGSLPWSIYNQFTRSVPYGRSYYDDEYGDEEEGEDEEEEEEDESEESMESDNHGGYLSQLVSSNFASGTSSSIQRMLHQIVNLRTRSRRARDDEDEEFVDAMDTDDDGADDGGEGEGDGGAEESKTPDDEGMESPSKRPRRKSPV